MLEVPNRSLPESLASSGTWYTRKTGAFQNEALALKSLRGTVVPLHALLSGMHTDLATHIDWGGTQDTQGAVNMCHAIPQLLRSTVAP
jgi:hypothetical protein